MPLSPENLILVTKVRIRPEAQSDFVDWQAKLNALIAAHPGFVSLEISSLPEKGRSSWIIVQRFSHPENVSSWRQLPERKQLIQELQKLLVSDSSPSLEETESTFHTPTNVTEVFVTQVHPDKEETYREWIAKIHQVEAKFPGFQGVYVQSPEKGHSRNWITLLRFDTLANLDRWLSSPEREQVLLESKSLIESLESHRVISPYAGWFASVSTATGKAPPVWKQTMLVLLVLFPIVMLELKYLSPAITSLNSSLATFIGNALSVTLIAWPMMPIALRFLGWWLVPQDSQHSRITFLGTALVFALYLLEMIIFWNLL